MGESKLIKTEDLILGVSIIIILSLLCNTVKVVIDKVIVKIELRDELKK